MAESSLHSYVEKSRASTNQVRNRNLRRVGFTRIQRQFVATLPSRSHDTKSRDASVAGVRQITPVSPIQSGSQGLGLLQVSSAKQPALCLVQRGRQLLRRTERRQPISALIASESRSKRGNPLVHIFIWVGAGSAV